MPDSVYLQKLYALNGGSRLNLTNPLSFNEKLNWLKINDRNPLYTKLVDKYDSKKFVAETIGEEYVVKNIGVYKNFSDIKIENLPNKFVVKTTHDSSGTIVCYGKDKFDILDYKKMLTKALKRNYYYQCREWPYKNVEPRLIIDELLETNTMSNGAVRLIDYKFWCFNGEPKLMYCTVKGAPVFENFYDMEFNPVYINHGFDRYIPEFQKPVNYNKMIELARVLSSKIGASFIRIDFFNIEGKIYFGEFTFFDWAGLKPFVNEETDLLLGKMIKLPNEV